ncbi:uncharacterized protein LOC132644397 [Lycium barbarum]|uniref:uncharacterized protein LOC132644397 n=1 Tax=Lycium barbarum TaxID=112863 RepID=UPI00293E0A8C|nr:uncharacterized protein LOC132644397 [Lycium barbarum]
MKTGTTLQDHLDVFNKLAMDLTHADIKVGDEELACILVFSLSPAYKDVVNSMMYNKEVVMLQMVRHALNSDELRNHINNDEKEDYGEGLTVRGRSSQRGRGQSVARSNSGKRVAQTSGEDYVLTASTDDIQTHKWILNSACTFHMCFRKDWFTSYE